MTSANDNKEKEEKPKFTVTDRRHSTQEDIAGANAASPEERYPSFVEKLKQEAEEKDKRLREYIAAYKTKTAENDEFRIRLQRENEARLDQFKANLLGKLVPILDNLRRAEAAARGNRDFDSLHRGIEMVISQFVRELQENEVATLEAKGRKFDPATDEACITVDTHNPEEDNMVLEDLEPGYKFREKLIKPVKVKVARLKNRSA